MIAALLLAASSLATPPQQVFGGGGLSFGRFGHISIYEPVGTRTGVALFFSGDGGWNEGVIDMAHGLVASGTLVIGVDTPRYLAQVDRSGESCEYLAADAEQLSQYVQKQLGLPRYQPPVLVGYSSGAGLAYATLAQAPDNTFQGAVSLGFDPMLPNHTAPCERNGLTSSPGPKGKGRLLGRAEHLAAPWIVLHGQLDRVSPIDSAEAFVKAVPGSEFHALATVGHGFSRQANWMPQLRDAVGRLTPEPTADPAPSADLSDLPVVSLPAPAPTDSGDYFAIVLSGDGGWASIDKRVGEELVAAGIPTVGFNSLQYFWRKRTPDEISAGLGRLIRHYQAAFGRERVVLVGYSRGADVLPLMVSRLPAALADRIRLVAFLGLEHKTNLEFRLGDWLGPQHDASYPLLPEIRKLAGHPMLCVYGAREHDTLCPDLPSGLADVVRLEGGHHFDGDYRDLARLIMDHVH
jgi:type IV secretory pathway VirJ component